MKWLIFTASLLLPSSVFASPSLQCSSEKHSLTYHPLLGSLRIEENSNGSWALLFDTHTACGKTSPNYQCTHTIRGELSSQISCMSREGSGELAKGFLQVDMESSRTGFFECSLFGRTKYALPLHHCQWISQ